MRRWFPGCAFGLSSCVFLLLSVACSDDKPEPRVGGDTHWLVACDNDEKCDRGTCVCGVCTESCSGDAQCAGGLEAQCSEIEVAAVSAACADGEAPEKGVDAICLAGCEQADAESEAETCPEGLECSAGVCLPPIESTEDTQEPIEPVSARPSTRASELAGLEPSSSLSFDDDEVLPLPEPERFFRESAEALLGTWRQVDCPPADDEFASCATLIFESTGPGGAVRGELRWESELKTGQQPATTNWESAPLQEYAPASDPNVGYPIEVPPEAYLAVSRHGAGPYTMLDPHFDGERAQFWVSTLEVWEDWCASQISYRVPGGNPPYQCVPEGAALGDPEVDRGKVVLCTSEWSAGECEVFDCGITLTERCDPPRIVGCSCITEGYNTMDQPECSIAYCRCDADGCAPNWYERRRYYELSVDDDRLIGVEGFSGRGGVKGAFFEREVMP